VTINPKAHGATRRCQPMSRSWPADVSSHGKRATRTTMMSIRYAPVKPLSRPAAVSSPPGALSEPNDALRMAVPRVTPNPSPASAAVNDPGPRRGTWPVPARGFCSRASALGRGDRRAHHQAIVLAKHEGTVTASSSALPLIPSQAGLAAESAVHRHAEIGVVARRRGVPAPQPGDPVDRQSRSRS
jgi:hypothetical protein